jgi:hypothetical protein
MAEAIKTDIKIMKLKKDFNMLVTEEKQFRKFKER